MLLAKVSSVRVGGMPAPALESSDDRLGGLHTLGQLRLGEPGADAGLHQRPRQRELEIEIVISSAVVRVPAPLPVQVTHLAHSSTSRARCSASRTSPCGGLARLLDEHSYHHHASLTGRHVEGARYSVAPRRAHFPDGTPEVLDVWFADAFQSNRRDELADTREPGAHVRGQGVELTVDGVVQGLDRTSGPQTISIAYVLCAASGPRIRRSGTHRSTRSAGPGECTCRCNRGCHAASPGEGRPRCYAGAVRRQLGASS